VRTGRDRGDLPFRPEDVELLAVLGGVVRSDIERPCGWDQVRWQEGVGEDRIRGGISVRLDDIDGPSVGLPTNHPIRHERAPKDMDLLRGVVVHHTRPLARQRMPPTDPDRSVLRAVAPDRHDLVA